MRRYVKRVWLPQVVAVDGAVAEGEEGGERGVYDIRQNQVWQHVPPWVVRTRWPRADERPPEEDRRAEKTKVFELVPVFVLEREVVGGRDVPAKEDEVHREPCDQRDYEEMSKRPQTP